MVAKFGKKAIQSVNNVISFPHGSKDLLHNMISRHYSSKTALSYLEDGTHVTVRKWLQTKSFEEQYEYGIKMIEYFSKLTQ